MLPVLEISYLKLSIGEHNVVNKQQHCVAKLPLLGSIDCLENTFGALEFALSTFKRV